MNKHNDIYSRDYISYYIDSEKIPSQLQCIVLARVPQARVQYHITDERYFSVARVLLK